MRRGDASIAEPSYAFARNRQGLGDCFLISVLQPPKQDFHLMIDCGVILGTRDACAKLQAVIADIIKTTDGKVDVLAVTHEHYDHVAGFVLADDLFAAPGDRADPKKLAVEEVWFAWTEDPKDKLARKLRKSRADKIAALSAMVQRMNSIRRHRQTARGGGTAAVLRHRQQRQEGWRHRTGDDQRQGVRLEGFLSHAWRKDRPAEGSSDHILRPRPAEGREEPQEDRFHDRGVPSWT